MCGRFVISSKNPFDLEYTPSYNVTPSQLVPVMTIHRVKLIKWSYSPLWRKDMNLINCRSETMKEKPSFKDAKRCVIYHDGWYEWQRKGKEKIPFYHSSKSNNFAGLYNGIGCLILTRNSTNKINHIHHRQPVLLNNNEISRYLEGEDILNSSSNNEIEFHQVSKDVNNPQNNNPTIVNAIDLY